MPVGFGLFVYLFLYIFKPFNLAELHVNDELYYIFIISAISFAVIFTILFLLPIFFKNFFNARRWTIGKSVLITSGGFVLIGFLTWWYSLASKPKELPTESLFVFILYILAVGGFPVLLFYIVDESLSREKREKIALKINTESPQAKDPLKAGTTILLKSENNKEELIVPINDLVYLSSERNYVSVFVKKEGVLKERILRTTLTKVTDDLSVYENMIRCHKSYIINTNYVKKIQGNARSYVLKSSIIPFKIPVSRSFPKDSLSKLVGNS